MLRLCGPERQRHLCGLGPLEGPAANCRAWSAGDVPGCFWTANPDQAGGRPKRAKGRHENELSKIAAACSPKQGYPLQPAEGHAICRQAGT